jgi:hypothetical protein
VVRRWAASAAAASAVPRRWQGWPSLNGERWLLDAAGVVFGERPLVEGGHFLGEERVGVGECLCEGAGQSVVERGPGSR